GSNRAPANHRTGNPATRGLNFGAGFREKQLDDLFQSLVLLAEILVFGRQAQAAAFLGIKRHAAVGAANVARQDHLGILSPVWVVLFLKFRSRRAGEESISSPEHSEWRYGSLTPLRGVRDFRTTVGAADVACQNHFGDSSSV